MSKFKTPASKLSPLITSVHWELLEEYLAVEKAQLVIRLCNCNESQLKDFQGQLKTLESLLKLRENLKMEMGSKR
jgi:hypothetical protein